MGKQEDLTKNDRNIKEAEAQVAKLTGDIGTLNKEIDRLELVQNHLRENLHFLKKSKIVALVQEFKKAKDDLKTANDRIRLLAGNRDNFKATCKMLEKKLKKAKEENEKLIRSAENNVLTGKFRSKHNGEG